MSANVGAEVGVEGAQFRGRILASKLRLDELLATGSMGEVWRARHLDLDKDVAVKVLRPDRITNAEMSERFIREARTASRLDHPNTVSVLDFGKDEEGAFYLAMELLSGETLAKAMLERGRLPLRESCYLMCQVLAGLAAAHDAQVLHRDIKPSNIMLVPRQDDDGHPTVQVKVCDFGLAKFSNQAETLAGAEKKLIGTPLYMSPEQAVNNDLDPRTDIYACGVVFFEMLTGRPPYEAERAVAVLMKHCAAPIPYPSKMVDGLPEDVDQVIHRAMAKERGHRYLSAREFRIALIQLGRIAPPVTNRPNLANGSAPSSTSYFLTPSSTGSFDPVPHPSSTNGHVSPSEGFELPIEGPVEASPTTPEAHVVSSATPETRAAETPSGLNTPRSRGPRPPPPRLPPSPMPALPEQPTPEIVPAIRSFERPKKSAVNGDARFLWERYALSQHRKAPARGFWLIDSQEHKVGPLAFYELCPALRLEAQDGGLTRSFVSADPKPEDWRPAEALLATLLCSGIARLQTPKAYHEAMSGPIEATSVPALMAWATRQAMTGRVIIAEPRTAQPVFFEVHIVSGRPTFVDTNELSLQYPAILIDKGALAEDDLPHLVSAAWSQDTSLDMAARSLAGVELEDHRDSVMKRRLRYILQLTNGQWAIDTAFVPHERRAIGGSLLEVLPRLTRDSIPRDTMEAALIPHMNRPLSSIPGLLGSVSALGLNSADRTVAEELIAAPRLQDALPARDHLRRNYLTVAYLLVATSTPLTSTPT